MSYRWKQSSAWTGRAPRSTDQRWPNHPRSFYNNPWRKFLIWLCGH